MQKCILYTIFGMDQIKQIRQFVFSNHSKPGMISSIIGSRGGSRISEKGVQAWKKGVRLPHFTQNVLKFPMKMK